MVYKYLGWGITNENGVAKLDHDAQGQEISHSYTGSGAGEIDVVASLDNPVVEGSIVSGTLKVLDCLIYDDGHTGTASNKWWNWSSCPSTVVRSPSGADYTSITSVNERGYSCFNLRGLGVTKIIFDVYKTGGARSDILFQLRDDNMSVVCQYALSSFSNLELDTWYTVEIDLFDGTVTIDNQTLTYTPNDETQFVLSAYSQSETRFRDLKILNESKDKILISATNDVIQSTETTDITGKLYVDGTLMLNTDIDIYKNGSKVDTVNTGSTGTASYTYTGVGDGECEFQFKYGSIFSETYEVIDATLIDPISATTRADIWYNNNNPQIDVNNGVVTLTESSGSVQSIFKSEYVFSKSDMCIEFDFYQVDGSTNQNVFWLLNDSIWTGVCSCDLSALNLASQQWHHIKIEFKGTKAIFNGVNKDYASTVTDNIRFGFLTNGDITSIKYKNFCLYPI